MNLASLFALFGNLDLPTILNVVAAIGHLFAGKTVMSKVGEMAAATAAALPPKPTQAPNTTGALN